MFTPPIQHMSPRNWAARAVALAFVFLAASFASAQVLYGTLTGNVTDPTGAVIPSATVKAVNTETGLTREAQTNDGGTYTFSDLQAGAYVVTTTAPGFGQFQQSVQVLTNTTFRANAQLKVGTSSQEVTVNENPPALQTEKAETSYNLDAEQIAALPTTSTTGRNFQSLYKLVPGSTPPAEQNSQAGNPQRAQAVNVNGISNATNTTRIDGAVDAYPWLPYLVAYLPPTDGIESINLVTGSFNAEQGSAGGAAINVTIKSGTNKLHGSGWFYNSISQENAHLWQDRTGLRPKNIYNEFGGSFGGPILKDKLFFFGDFNRVTTRKAINGTLSLPTAAMRVGDFSGTGVTIYDPATGTATGTGKTPFANNMIPSNRFSPAAVKLLTALPLPNVGASGALVNNFFGSTVNGFNRNNIDAKITYVPTDRTSIFGHYSYSPNDISDPQQFGSIPGGGTYDGGQVGHATGLIQNVGLGATHAFSSHVFLDANAGYTRQRLGAQSDDLTLGDYGSSASGLNIPGANYNGQNLYGGLPAFFFNTYAGLGNTNTGNPFLFRDNQYTGNVNGTWVKGAHSFRAGGEYIHAAINHFQPGSGTGVTPRGAFTFSGGVTTVSGGTISNVNSIADFLLGQATTYGKGVQSFNPLTFRNSVFAFYAQDTWQASNRLTLNYGVRYEYYPISVADHFGTVRYDPSLRSTITDSLGTHTVGTVIVGGRGGNDIHAGINNHHGQIVPRFGIDYRVDDKTVIRSGFGITVDPDTLRNLLNAYPASVTTNPSGANSYVAVTSLNAGLQSTTTQVGIPALTIPDISSGFLPLATNLATNAVPQDFRRGYIESYNLSIQHQFPGQMTASAAYVGSHAVRQSTNVNINAAPVNGGTAGRLLNTTYGANTNNNDINSLLPFQGSVYNGLQTQVERRSTRHGSFGVIYTFSKAMDASDNSQANGLVFAYPAYQYRNWALAGYDRKHNFQLWTVTNLPFGKDEFFAKSGIASAILGGFRLSTVLSRVSGTPFNVTAAGGTLNAPGNTQLADQNYGTPTVLASNVSGYRQYLNPAAYASVTAVRFGTSGRNSVRGPGLFNLDASLRRSFPIYERAKLELVGDFFNVTNTPQFANPASNISSGGFGVITTSNANRTMRFSGRITF